MHEQYLDAAAKCSHCPDSMCSGDLAAFCGADCGCDWRMCMKCMNDWQEHEFSEEAYEDNSDVEDEQVAKQQQRESEKDGNGGGGVVGGPADC